jgi:hypothetical protein
MKKMEDMGLTSSCLPHLLTTEGNEWEERNMRTTPSQFGAGRISRGSGQSLMPFMYLCPLTVWWNHKELGQVPGTLDDATSKRTSEKSDTGLEQKGTPLRASPISHFPEPSQW